ncbi:hypothetical protein [Nocardia macrotermitis]|uniref:Uncharacterized protein n=1 Tax=Nocardia macrotermitis TaxID=2585198 RepID=A0A7K0DAC6_9NOCA|nr:hypothetical protein [Nocardia macrotermitis]MQY22735.1 hypothetical protein [Nocardia macrotermitis]
MSVEARPDPLDRTTLAPAAEATSIETTRAADGGDGPQVHTPESVTAVQPRGPADASRLRSSDPPGSDEQAVVESASPSEYSGTVVADDAGRSTEVVQLDRPAAQDEGQGGDHPDTELESVRERILAEENAREERQVAEVCAEYGIENQEQIAALREAHGVFTETIAPFVIEGAHRMLDSLRSKVEKQPDTVVVITCRDGLALGMAMEKIDPEFYKAHCRVVRLSRKCMENVVQDMENVTGQKFDDIEEMRDRSMIDPEQVPGAALRTQRHMLASGVPVTTPGANIVFIDSGVRGTIQELATAAWPKANYSSEFLNYVEFANDPHKGTKTGHFLHMSSDRVHPSDLDDPVRIFDNKLAGRVYEELMHGATASTIGHDENGNPVYGTESSSADQVAPYAISAKYEDSNLRMAIMDIAQRAVSSRARTAAESVAAGIDYREDLRQGVNAYIRKVQSWVNGDDTGDPEFKALADSFVRREDKHLVHRLRTATSDLGKPAHTAVWLGYQHLSPADKERLVKQYERTALPPGSTAPEGSSDG